MNFSKSREEIIHDMCMTYRHDYGLRKSPGEPPWTSGMTEEDAKMLYKVMEQIYNNNIEPILSVYQQHLNGVKNAPKQSKRSTVAQNKRRK